MLDSSDAPNWGKFSVQDSLLQRRERENAAPAVQEVDRLTSGRPGGSEAEVRPGGSSRVAGRPVEDGLSCEALRGGREGQSPSGPKGPKGPKGTTTRRGAGKSQEICGQSQKQGKRAKRIRKAWKAAKLSAELVKAKLKNGELSFAYRVGIVRRIREERKGWTREQKRDERFRLQNALRSIAPTKAIGGCGLYPVPMTTHVQAHVAITGRGRAAFYSHLKSCKSPWSCAVCAPRLASARMLYLREGLMNYFAEDPERSTLMLSLTASHKGRTISLRNLRRGVCSAFSRMTAHRAWKELRDLIDIEGTLRALEATWSERNSWHPHLHVIVLLRRNVRLEDRKAIEDMVAALWRSSVIAELGEKHAPSLEHGTQFSWENRNPSATIEQRAESAANYALKMALEMLNPSNTKAPFAGHATPWEIAELASANDTQAIALWDEWCKGMKGARQLYIHHKVKELLGVGEDEDEKLEMVTEDGEVIELQPDMEMPFLIPIRAWNWLAQKPMHDEELEEVRPYRSFLLTVLERHGDEVAYQNMLLTLAADAATTTDPATREHLSNVIEEVKWCRDKHRKWMIDRAERAA